MYTAINVIGPKAKELLAELTDAKLGSQDFMHMTCKVVLYQKVFVMNIII
jgi:pyruvate dehydrogenase phosphatase regulatory subunit